MAALYLSIVIVEKSMKIRNDCVRSVDSYD